jgi:hypothetical protein
MATSAPYSLPLAAALGRSEPLTSLLQRLRESQSRFEAVSGLLPEPLRATVRPGPLDDNTWVLLAANAAAAAKLRQCLPTLVLALEARGWQGPAIKVKVRRGV